MLFFPTDQNIIILLCVPSIQIVLCGDKETPDMNAMIACVNKSSLPSRVLIVHDGSDNCIVNALEVLKTMQPVHGKVTAFVCRNYSCSLPVSSVEELEKSLNTIYQ